MNYKIRTNEGPVVLDPDTFCPMKTLEIKIQVGYEAQHDGRSWTPKEVDDANQAMIEEVKAALNEKVSEFIKKVDPHSCHLFNDHP